MDKYSKTINEFRNHFPVTDEWAYFETASTGLVPDFVYEGTRRYIDDRYYRGGNSSWEYEDGVVNTIEMMKRSKQAIASMIHGDPDDIAFGMSATQLLSLITEGIDYSESDNIVTVDHCWIGARYAWQKKQADGLEVRFVEPVNGAVTAEMIIEACDKNTKVISINYLESTTGYRIDIDRLGMYCKSQDIIFCVDAVQAIGVLNIDVRKSNIDFMVGNDYKWMMNYCGTGIAYIRPEIRRLVKHWGAGWLSDTDRFNINKPRLDIRDDAGRFEIGHLNISGIYGLGLVAKQNLIIGMNNIETYVLGLADYFKRKVEENPLIKLKYDFAADLSSPLVLASVTPAANISDMLLKHEKIALSGFYPNANGEIDLRFAFHYYNNTSDIDRFFALLS